MAMIVDYRCMLLLFENHCPHVFVQFFSASMSNASRDYDQKAERDLRVIPNGVRPDLDLVNKTGFEETRTQQSVKIYRFSRVQQ